MIPGDQGTNIRAGHRDAWMLSSGLGYTADFPSPFERGPGIAKM